MTELSDLERTFLTRLMQLAPDLPTPIPQFRFSPQRQWAFDWSWPEYHVAVECQGGTWNGGRHVRGKGYAEDCEKLNAAQIDGWTVLRYTSDQLENDPARVIFEVTAALDRTRRLAQEHSAARGFLAAILQASHQSDLYLRTFILGLTPDIEALARGEHGKS